MVKNELHSKCPYRNTNTLMSAIITSIRQFSRDRRGCDGTVVGFTTTYSISVYHH